MGTDAIINIFSAGLESLLVQQGADGRCGSLSLMVIQRWWPQIGIFSRTQEQSAG